MLLASPGRSIRVLRAHIAIARDAVVGCIVHLAGTILAAASASHLVALGAG